MTKYQIYKILGSEQEYFYCKQKFGPFWVTPSNDYLRYDVDYGGMGKNPKCKRFKTKEELLELIKMAQDREIDSLRYQKTMSKIVHQPLEIV